MKRWLFPILLIIAAALAGMIRAEETERPVIYQLMVRTFGNTNENRKPNGTLAENGCGKFADINDAALASLKRMGFTHVWLTGVFEQASGTTYPHRPADDADILKGIAGSPYAIKDYFDVCPDYALDPEKRHEEFRKLLDRCHRHGLRVIIDFVPNHVARSYQSDIRPDLSFGAEDDHGVFFHRDNHFFYLQGEGATPLELPTSGQPGCDGKFPPEAGFTRVTGNNSASRTPSRGDWYETVKLNYGHDYTAGRDTSHLPGADSSPDEVPRTWRTMDEILAYWQKMGVNGFRTDMAHMVPMEFWRWAVKRCRSRDPQVFLAAEAYDDDPAKLTDGHVLDALLKAGFDAVYDDPSRDVLEGLYESGKWANDLDSIDVTGERFHHSLRYSENHDETRLANPHRWGGLGMKVGKPVTAALFAMGRGPVMLYHGQEVGEPAEGAEGFGGDDARTTIFDYWSMPAFTKWVNRGKFDGGLLSTGQKSMRQWYAKLIHAIRSPAFTHGEYFALNHANRDNPDYGRLGNETVSGHWLHAFIRHDERSGSAFLVVANFHGSETMRGLKIRIPQDVRRRLDQHAGATWILSDRLDSDWTASISNERIGNEGISIPDLAPCSAMLLEIGR